MGYYLKVALILVIAVAAVLVYIMLKKGEYYEYEHNKAIEERMIDLEEKKIEQKEIQMEKEKIDMAKKEISLSKCDFSKEVELKETDYYGIFGDDEFDTVVCGYLLTKEAESFGETQTNAYFEIIDYYNPDFAASLEEGIDMGNSINSVGEDGYYQLNLGCYENGEILGIQYSEDEVYMDDETHQAILSSAKAEPISLILSFGKHEGFGCVCCNLAHEIRLY